MSLSATPEQLERLIAAGEEMSEHLQSFVAEIDDLDEEGDADLLSDLNSAIDRFDSIRVEIEGIQQTMRAMR